MDLHRLLMGFVMQFGLASLAFYKSPLNYTCWAKDQDSPF
jgi:hypothetical protein